jgi:TolB protein
VSRAFAVLAVLAALAATPAGSGAATQARSLQAAAAPELVYSFGGDIWTARTNGTAKRQLTRGTLFEAGPAWSPDGRRIAYVSQGRTNAELYAMDADGRNRKRLTNARGDDYSPAWSPDGTSIAFSSNRFGPFEIFVMRADGTGVRRIARGRGPNGSYTPSWSPDGKWIAFSSSFRTPENPEIYVVRPDGTGLKRLTRTAGDAHRLGDDGWPSWSPDGKRIVFSSNRTGNGEVWIMNADGTGQRRVAGLARRDDWGPRFSHDGRTIAFHSLYLSAESRIYVVRPDGTGLRRLPVDGMEVNWRPAVGTRTLAATAAGDIVFTRHLGGTGVGDIYSVSADGSGLRRLTTSRNNFDAVYSPDGKRIAFASDRVRAGAPELYVMDANGRNVRRLTHSANTSGAFVINSQPAWTPDGKAIAFVRTLVRIAGSTETTDLWRVSASGGAPTQITRHAGREASPAFTSTGILTFERDGKLYRLVHGRALFELVGTEPAWGPKGEQLAFVRGNAVYVTRGGKPAKVADGSAPSWSGDGRRLVYSTKDGLYSVAVDGTNRRRLTNPGYPRADLSPSWRGTAARTLQSAAATELGFVRGGAIYTARTDGTGVRRLTTGSSIAWSPDGKRVAFARRDVLYVADADGRGERRLVRGFGTGNGEVWIMNANGTGQRRLAGTRERDDWAPRFSPDGAWIAFESRRLQGSDVYLVRADGTGVSRVAVRASQPAWRP